MSRFTEEFKKAWKDVWPIKSKPPVKKLLDTDTLPDIVTKMLVDRGCTINKEGAEALAEYIVSTCLQITQDMKAAAEKTARDIKEERSKW